MVAFRKLFPVLAIVTFLLGTATIASAQGLAQPFVCATDAGVAPLLVQASANNEVIPSQDVARLISEVAFQ